MFLAGIDIAVPERRYTQKQCWEALQRADRPELNARVRSILQGILTHDNGIETRALALESLDDGFDLDPDTLHRRFVTHAPRLASQAAEAPFGTQASQANRIDAVVVSTCTGYLCPGLSELRRRIAGAALRRSSRWTLSARAAPRRCPTCARPTPSFASQRADRVLSICVESAAPPSISTTTWACSSARVSSATAPRLPCWRASPAPTCAAWSSRCGLDDGSVQRDALRFEQRGGMLRNILTLRCRSSAARHARKLFDEVTGARGRCGVIRSADGSCTAADAR
jgi:alkylresorcinol/alkylpyrone synthase